MREKKKREKREERERERGKKNATSVRIVDARAIKHIRFSFNELKVIKSFAFFLLYVVVELYYRSFLTCDIIDRLLICYSIVTYLSV